MNLLEAISIEAGGPGSGCNGPNCGRPRGAGGYRYTAKQREKLLKRFASPMPKNIPGLTKQGQIEKGVVQKRSVGSQFLTNEGAHYTLIKSPRAHGEARKNAVGASKLKGLFRHEVQVQGIEKTRLVAIFRAAKPGAQPGEGQTLLVHRDYGQNKVIIQEFTHGIYGHIEQERDYKFKGFGRAMGFLNSRYGVRLALPKAGWDK